MNIAWFISPHGFGHAARSAAVIATLQQKQPGLDLDLYTHVPAWFFQEALPGRFKYHDWVTDVGLVQKSALEEDLPATLERLEDYLSFRGPDFQRLVREVAQAKPQLVICDIAPLGIIVAHQLGLPAVLLENFTWDWIYTGYLDQAPGFASAIETLQAVFASAGVHIQAEPACQPSSQAGLQAPPISRSPRSSRSQIRYRLEIPDRAKIVLVTMGGVPTQMTFYPTLPDQPDLFFVIPGGSHGIERQANRILLPHHSEFYHPDLVHASDVVLGKAGYSTVAEAYWAGIPFLYLSRSQFREAQVLGDFIQANMDGAEVTEAQLERGDWLPFLREIVDKPLRVRPGVNGAQQVADFLLGMFPHS